MIQCTSRTHVTSYSLYRARTSERDYFIDTEADFEQNFICVLAYCWGATAASRRRLAQTNRRARYWNRLCAAGVLNFLEKHPCVHLRIGKHFVEIETGTARDSRAFKLRDRLFATSLHAPMRHSLVDNSRIIASRNIVAKARIVD